MIVLFVTATLKNLEDRDALLQALKKATPGSLAEPGVQAYSHGVDPNDALVIRAVEVFSSEASILEHIGSPHMAAMFAETAEIDSDIRIEGFQGEMSPFSLDALLSTGSADAATQSRFRDKS